MVLVSLKSINFDFFCNIPTTCKQVMFNKASVIHDSRRGSRGGVMTPPPPRSRPPISFFNKLFNYSNNNKKIARNILWTLYMYLNLMFINPRPPVGAGTKAKAPAVHGRRCPPPPPPPPPLQKILDPPLDRVINLCIVNLQYRSACNKD